MIMKLEEKLIDACVPFSDNPFKIKDDFDMDLLVQSILNYGVMYPIMVRPLEDGEYEIISGHRRVHACKKAGIEKIPAFIRPMSRDEAVICLVDSNLQRERLLPSEKAFAYKMKVDALTHQGKTSVRLGQKTSRGLVAENVRESETQIQRYIRLTHLIKPLLNLVDEGRIALSPAVELSYLPETMQKMIYDYYAENEVTPSYSQASQMKKRSIDRMLTPERLLQILNQPKPNQAETIKIPIASVQRYRPNDSVKQLQDFIERACAYYSRYLRNRDRDAR
ncbi:MAG: ParB/RepB/Spo0J family partition protein [Clostridia bacterium]|nr:ParB/RepB/Spo0J family partition protein [Clostridia bacterium]